MIQQPRGQVEHHHATDRPTEHMIGQEPAAETHVVDQSQGHRAEEQDARGVDQVEVNPGQAGDRQVVDFLESLQQHERPAEREREITA